MQMMAPVYGLAEQASALILSQNGGAPMPGAAGINSTTQSTTSGTTGGKSPVQTEQGNKDGSDGSDGGSSSNGAAFTTPSVGLSLLALVAGALAML